MRNGLLPVQLCTVLACYMIFVVLCLMSQNARADRPRVSLKELHQLWNKRDKHGELKIQNKTIEASAFATLLTDSNLPLRKQLWENRIFLDHCTITGDFVIKDKTVKLYFTVVDCRFAGKIDCQNITFLQRVSFQHVDFDKGHEIYFSKVHFRGDTWLENCTCPDGVGFSDAVFDQIASFVDTRFGNYQNSDDSSTSFSHVQFKDIVQFNGARFKSDVEFTDDTIFTKVVKFSLATFTSEAKFTNVIFDEAANFDGAIMQGRPGVEFISGVVFRKVTFKQTATFVKVILAHKYLAFDACIFTDDALFIQLDGARNGILRFWTCIFKGRTYLTGAHLHFVGISTYIQEDNGDRRRVLEAGPSVFEKAAQFEQMECDIGDFEEAEFRDDADFGDTQFKRFADFDHVLFGGTVIFRGYSDKFIFPDVKDAPRDERFPVGLWMDRVRFNKTVQWEWKQLVQPATGNIPVLLAQTKLVTSDYNTWNTIEQAFKANGDIEGQNEARYRSLLLRRKGIQDYISWNFWGFGLRPSLVFVWMLMLLVACACVYWRMYKRHTTEQLLIFDATQIPAPEALAKKLIDQTDSISKFLWENTLTVTRQQLLRHNDPTYSPEELRSILLSILNEKVFDSGLESLIYRLSSDNSVDNRPDAEKTTGLSLIQTNYNYLVSTYKDVLKERSGRSYLLNALYFSWRTCFALDYGVKNARSESAKFVARFQSIAFKILFFFWITALSNTTPLLKELVSKLIPV